MTTKNSAIGIGIVLIIVVIIAMLLYNAHVQSRAHLAFVARMTKKQIIQILEDNTRLTPTLPSKAKEIAQILIHGNGHPNFIKLLPHDWDLVSPTKVRGGVRAEGEIVYDIEYIPSEAKWKVRAYDHNGSEL